MSKLRLLDLFCGAGGASVGYYHAGFSVAGIDHAWQENYPFFMRRESLFPDATGSFATWIRENFDAVHASPPCQRYSDLAKRNGNADSHPDLVPLTREVLRRTGLPYVIENVEGAPLINPVTLCGTMFPEQLRVLRHRLFESNIPLTTPPHGQHPLVYTMDKRKGHYGKLDEATAFVQVTGGGNCSKAAASSAMGIDWMTKEELNQAIPPAFTKFIGAQLAAHIHAQRAEKAAA